MADVRTTRDGELNRYRYSKWPDLVAYPGKDDPNVVRVFDEVSCTARYFNRKDIVRSHSADRFYDVAKEHFESFPEPKPWDNAKPGEVWLITVNSDTTYPAIVVEDAQGFIFKIHDPEILESVIDVVPGTTLNGYSKGGITDAVKIWPEPEDLPF